MTKIYELKFKMPIKFVGYTKKQALELFKNLVWSGKYDKYIKFNTLKIKPTKKEGAELCLKCFSKMKLVKTTIDEETWSCKTCNKYYGKDICKK